MNFVSKYRGVEDYFYGGRGAWDYEMDDSGHLRISEIPDNLASYYSNYSTHSSSDEFGSCIDFSARRQYVLQRKLGHSFKNQKSGFSVFYAIASWAPTVTSSDLMSVLKIRGEEFDNKHVLDFGCGSGLIAARFAALGANVVGYEPDSSAACFNSNFESFQAFCDLEQCAATRDSGFDFIVLNHVIEHLESPLTTISRLKLMLAPGGRLLITTPNANSLFHKIFGRYWRGLEAPRHLHVFTKKSLGEVLQSSGFPTMEISTEVRSSWLIFYSSFLAFLGFRSVEVRVGRSRFLVLVAGLMQVIEHFLAKFGLFEGEELFARVKLEEASDIC